MMETLIQKGISYWLTNLPIKELWTELAKREFWMPTRLDKTSHLIEFHLSVSVGHHVM